MSQMQLFMGDEGEQTKGLPQVQDQIGCEENEKGLNEYSGGGRDEAGPFPFLSNYFSLNCIPCRFTGKAPSV